MIVFPAIDIYEGRAVRLEKGDYDRMTVYSDDPASFAGKFRDMGAGHVHVVDLEGARDGGTPNIKVIEKIASESGLFVETGGGIRSMDIIDRYLAAGVSRVILGTAAVKDEELLRAAVKKYGEKIAVGIDLKDGFAAIKGWTEKTDITADAFFGKMSAEGVGTVICTDISKDGMMGGTNLGMYADLSAKYDMDIIASGGVSTISDVAALAAMGMYGCIIGKAYYTGAIDIAEAVRTAGTRGALK